MNFGYALADEGQSAFARDLIAGLQTTPKTLPSKYFYDEEGSRLFDRITTLPEYYLTRTELALLRTHAREMAATIGPDVELVEFGAGALEKVGILFRALERPRSFIPIDISREYLRARAADLARRFPRIAMRPLVADFTAPLALPPSSGRRAGFFPGSTIGNLDTKDALAFLSRAAKLFRGRGLLIGVDLVKAPAVLHEAYNDAAGVTADFNKNILAHANRELSADFDLDAFAHYAFYEPRRARIEMHLVSLRRHHVRAAGKMLAFAEGESIHTENSHKYTIDGFRALAAEAGLKPGAVWTDAERLFSIHWLEA